VARPPHGGERHLLGPVQRRGVARDMPDRYGSCKTAHDRFRRWQRDGTWDRVLAALRLRADAAGLLDYAQYNADSTSVRATRAAGGARKKAARKRWA